MLMCEKLKREEQSKAILEEEKMLVIATFTQQKIVRVWDELASKYEMESN